MDAVIKKFPLQIREHLKHHVKKIILFGSRARGDFYEGSDYDFAVIVDKKNKQIEEAVLNISSELFFESDILIGSILWDEKEWDLTKKFPIGLNILKDGIEL